MAGLAFLVFAAAVAVLAPFLAPDDPQATDLANTLAAPGGDHLLGTDALGRDVLSRLMHATRVSLVAAFLAVGVGIVLGVPPGLVAGYVGGAIDNLVMRVTDAVMSFPPLILAIAIVGVLGPNLTNAMIAVGVIFAPRFLRLVRSTVLGVREETYIEAARSVGVSTRRIIIRHVMPNALAPLVVQISLSAGLAMIAEASLSFLGLGIQPPEASWGSMLGDAFRYISRSPTLIVVPGVAIAATVLAFNVVGDGLRDSFGREIRRDE